MVKYSMLSFTKEERSLIRSLSTPQKIQDFLNTIPINHELDGIDRVKSPVRVLRERSAHCIEAALLGAYILSVHGYEPLLVHLQTTKEDFEHVIAPFKVHGLWGALSKTNHPVLRYRDPLYKTLRELVLSYFHEYTYKGKKTLRSYSEVLHLNKFEDTWPLSEEDLWGIDEALGSIKHYSIVPKWLKLRDADKIEQVIDTIEEWPRKSSKTKTSSKRNKSVV